MKPIRLISGFLTVGVWTLLSRVLGFVRDIMIAGALGTGAVAEAFFVAFALPNMFRRFFAEGAFNMAFVPMFAKKLERGEDARGFAEDALAGLASVLVVFSLLAQLVMPWLVLAMAGGFAADERLLIANGFGRIVFVYILLISLAALMSGVLNALGRFAAAAAAPVLLNIILVSVLLLAREGVFPEGIAIGTALSDPPAGLLTGTVLSWAVIAAGIAQLVLVWIAAGKAGMKLRLRLPRMTPEMKRLAIIAVPAALSGGVVQINLLVGRQVASFFDGAIAWLSYADRLYQLPLGVVGIAVGIVLLPDLSRRLADKDASGGRNAFNRACEFSLALTLPAAAALVAVPTEIVSVLFQRGAFDAADSAATGAAVAIYGIGLPAFVLQKAFQPLFFARHDTRTPFRYALIAMVVNAIVAIGLALAIGYTAAAWGTTLAGWAMVWLLWRGSRRLGEEVQFDDRLKTRLPRLLLSSVLMGVLLWLAAWIFADALQTAGLRYLALALLVGFGAVSYFALCQITGAMRLAELKGFVRHSKA